MNNNEVNEINIQKKSNKGKIILITIMGLIIVGLCAFITIKILPSKSKTNNEENNIVSPNTTSDTARESNAENPLKINEWGKASKYVNSYLDDSYKDTSYVDVPVRITKIVRGEEAKKLAKEWFNTQNIYKYQEPKETTEWLYIEYEEDLNELKFKEGGIGTSVKVGTELKGIDGESLRHNKITYLLTTKDISSPEYANAPGIYKGSFISNIPVGCTEYLIKFGDGYNKTQAFVKGE